MQIDSSERWEIGSDFHWDFKNYSETIKDQLIAKSQLLGTGRYALKLIIDWGRRKYNWKRIWLPSYFCPEVIDSIITTGIKTEFYYDDPINGFNIYENNYEIGDVILVNNLFGLRSQPLYNSLKRSYIQIIEDHSHDPWSDWSLNSEADWCFASLRKSLPISDGAILWSPKGHQMPPWPQLSSNHYQASLEKFIGMVLKTNYLQGMSVDKEYYRDFLINGERRIGTSESSDITDFSKKQLSKIPIDFIREKKNQNRAILINQIRNLKIFQILESSQSPNSCPFSVILYFNTTRIKEFFFNSLLENKIYPAILWPIKEGLSKQIPSSNIDFSNKMFSLHCDYRYNAEDMSRISENIIRISKKL